MINPIHGKKIDVLTVKGSYTNGLWRYLLEIDGIEVVNKDNLNVLPDATDQDLRIDPPHRHIVRKDGKRIMYLFSGDNLYKNRPLLIVMPNNANLEIICDGLEQFRRRSFDPANDYAQPNFVWFDVITTELGDTAAENRFGRVQRRKEGEGTYLTSPPKYWVTRIEDFIVCSKGYQGWTASCRRSSM